MKCACALVAILCWQSVRAESRWQSTLSLWDHAAAVSPRKPRVLLNAGVAHVSEGDALGACPLLLTAEALGVRPSDEWAQNVHLAATINLFTLRASIACP